MALVKWDPFREMYTPFGRFGRWFNEFPEMGENTPAATWSPAVDILEKDHDLVIKAELPGVNKEDLEIRLENNVLTLRGERKFEKETKKENYHRVEWEYGTFVRSFALPATVNESAVHADFKDGVLKVTLPKKEMAKATEIKVNAA